MGTITDVTDEKIVLEVPVGKKKEIVVTEIPFTDIKEAVVQISF